MEFTYDGGGVGKGGDVALFVDGEQVGEGRVDGTVPMVFSADETTDVGSDTATPVSDDYGVRGQRVHRHGALGPDRPRRGRGGHRPSDHARGAAAGRDGAAVESSAGRGLSRAPQDERWSRYRSVAPGRVNAQITQTQSAITRSDQNG